MTKHTDIHILSLEEALSFIPDEPTYAIRISSPYDNNTQYPLMESPHYRAVHHYLFDDMWPGMPEDFYSYLLEEQYKPFTTETAHQIIDDFSRVVDSIDSLLVHCQYGLNRSPAVAIALNDIFELGEDSAFLKQHYPEYRRFIYKTLLEAGEEYL
jgi:predicted protein tyrosine phosphatase